MFYNQVNLPHGLVIRIYNTLRVSYKMKFTKGKMGKSFRSNLINSGVQIVEKKGSPRLGLLSEACSECFLWNSPVPLIEMACPE